MDLRDTLYLTKQNTNIAVITRSPFKRNWYLQTSFFGNYAMSHLILPWSIAMLIDPGIQVFYKISHVNFHPVEVVFHTHIYLIWDIKHLQILKGLETQWNKMNRALGHICAHIG